MINQDHLDSLFIRTYNTDLIGHSHDYHQILIPLVGNIKLIIKGKEIIVSYGEVYIIPKGVHHQFTARTDFRFLVINTDNIDFVTLESVDELHFSLDDKALAFIEVVEKQLLTDFDQAINDCMLKLLMEFLKKVSPDKRIDSRLINVLNIIKNDISAEHTLESLAKAACLSKSHFKKAFKKQFGYTPKAYITELRMQMARGLIINTDMPIAIIAEKCGYQNLSAFIRRFSLCYHETPQKFRSKRQSLAPKVLRQPQQS